MSTFGQHPDSLDKTRILFAPGDTLGHQLLEKGSDDGGNFELNVKKFNERGSERGHQTYKDGDGLAVSANAVELHLGAADTDKYEVGHRYIGILSFEDATIGTTRRSLRVLFKPVEYYQL